jgi:hypothetical protein
VYTVQLTYPDYVPHTHAARVPPRHSTASASRWCWLYSQQRILDDLPLCLYRCRFEADLPRLLLSLSCPAMSPPPAPTFQVRSVLHIYLFLNAIHNSTRCTSLIRASSLSCVRRLCRPHAHSFYCTRARLPSALPGHLSTSRVGLSLAPPPNAFRTSTCAPCFRLSRCSCTHVRSAPHGAGVPTLSHRPLDLAPLAPCAIRTVRLPLFPVY